MESMRRFLRRLEPNEQQVEEGVDDLGLGLQHDRREPPRPTAAEEPRAGPSRPRLNTSTPAVGESLGVRPMPGPVSGVLAKIPCSLVWDYFTKSADSMTAKCNLCVTSLKLVSQSTTSLRRHLQGKHALRYDELIKKEARKKTCDEARMRRPRPTPRTEEIGLGGRESRQQTLTSMTSLKQKWPHDHPSAKKVTRRIAEWIATDLQPYSVVEERGFQQVVHELNPQYIIPSRTTFSRSVVPQLYQDTVLKMHEELNGIKDKIESLSLTSDMWTSKSNQPYISLTCHYLSPDFTIVNRCLGNSHFPGTHDATSIYTKLTGMISEWQLDTITQTVPIFIISDNARNYTAALARTSWTALQCFAHTLQLAIADAKKDNIPDVIRKVRTVVSHYNRSAKASKRLGDFQIQMGLPSHKLCQDCPTRWNSEYDMLSRVVEQRNAICAELGSSEDRGSAELLDPNDWKIASGLVTVLRPFKEATVDISGEAYPTRSMIIPILTQVDSILTRFISEGERGTGIVFAKNLKRALNSRFPFYKSDKVNSLCMMLDPRYKDWTLRDDVSKFEAKARLRAELQTLYEPAQNIAPPSTVLDDELTSPSTSLWTDFDKMVDEEPTTNHLPDQEIDTFLAMSVISRTADPLAWWAAQNNRFPMLAKLARKYLPIPATQVCSERQFSAGSNTVTCRRQNLLDEHVEQLVFLHENMKGS